MQLSVPEAKQHVEELVAARAVCPRCIHAPFTAIILDFFQARGGNEEGAADVQAALRDTALSSTGTSQSVEKLHASVQVSQNTVANSGRKPATVQRESYVLSARIARSRLKGLIEKQVFGVGGLARARKLMGSRVVSRTKAANSSLRDYAPKQARVSSHRRQSKFVKDHVLKAQKKRVQKASNKWHAFLALHRGSKLCHDPQTMSSRYRHWLSSAIKRAELQQKVDDMARERAQLADNPVCADVQTASFCRTVSEVAWARCS